MLQDRNKKLAAIHIAKKELKLNDEAYRAILSGAGVYSASEIKTENQYTIIMQGFKNLGYVLIKKNKSNYSFKNQRSGGGKDRLTKKQEYYIRGLWDLASRVRSEESLNALILRIGKVIDISHLTVRNASKVILALRDICKKAGFNPDSKHS